VNPVLAGVALAVVAGAVVAVSVREARVVVLGLATVLIATPLVADPVAEPVGLAARLIGSVLAVYLLWIATRERPAGGRTVASTGGSRIGWPTEVLVAAAAAIVGFAGHGLGAPGVGPPLASAAGFAVAALALLPLLTGLDILRIGVGLFLLLDGVLLVRVGLGGTPDALEQLLTGGLLMALGGALAAMATSARLDGEGGFALAVPITERHRLPDAHPIDPPSIRRG
jgi:hypothetical protein